MHSMALRYPEKRLTMAPTAAKVVQFLALYQLVLPKLPKFELLKLPKFKLRELQNYS